MPVILPPGLARLLDETLVDGIVDARHDDGYRRGCLLCGLHARRGRGDDGIDFEVYEIGGELRQAVSHVIRCAVFDHDAASLGMTQLLQALLHGVAKNMSEDELNGDRMPMRGALPAVVGQMSTSGASVEAPNAIRICAVGSWCGDLFPGASTGWRGEAACALPFGMVSPAHSARSMASRRSNDGLSGHEQPTAMSLIAAVRWRCRPTACAQGRRLIRPAVARGSPCANRVDCTVCYSLSGIG